jgi:hypothetical protein
LTAPTWAQVYFRALLAVAIPGAHVAELLAAVLHALLRIQFRRMTEQS